MAKPKYIKPPNYNKMAKPGSFIDEYMKLFEHSETATSYDFWAACWLLSNASTRAVTIPRPNAPIYLNWYIILTAESGITRKSSAVNAAVKFYTEYLEYAQQSISNGTIRHRYANRSLPAIIQRKSSPEQFEARLHHLTMDTGSASAAIAVSELVTFLGREGYNRAMPGLLTDLYDCPRARDGGSPVVDRDYRNTFITFLSASTPSWLLRAINPDVIEGGFTSRVVFIHEERRKRKVPWPDAGPAGGSDQRERVLRLYHQIAERLRELDHIELSDRALSKFSTWYRRKPESDDPFRQSFESREDAHVLRLAAIMAISEQAYIISEHHVSRSIQAIEYIKESAASLFTETTGIDNLTNGISRIRSLLLEAGTDGLSQSTLSAKTRHLIARSDTLLALNIMHELNMVQQFEIKASSAVGGRPKTIWRATRQLAKHGSLDEILRGL